MAITNVPQRTATAATGAPASSNRVALSVVTTLFFMWGFVTVLNDVLVPHLKAIFDLNYARVMLIQFSFFSAYISSSKCRRKQQGSRERTPVAQCPDLKYYFRFVLAAAFSSITACAAASREMGTRNGDALT